MAKFGPLLLRLVPAIAIVALLVGLLVPVPAALLDLFLSLSLASAVIVLVAALRVRRVLELVAFPALLLLMTPVRLALNVSTTRLILSQADAGRVIDAFAGLVVRGDLLVGAVMFGVITTIQYLVIARGAERVAEVTARFTLDGLPGEQATIDRELVRGLIGAQEARSRRAAMQERADFFGRMDGVMRIVKGDALVGLLITTINLVGGVGVGTLRQGLGLVESLELYGSLAIGDGLLAQLPALLMALAAALLVVRVDRREGAPLTPAGAWLEPVMLATPAALLALLALVPGMPSLAFGTTALVLFGAAFAVHRLRRRGGLGLRLGNGSSAAPAPLDPPRLRARLSTQIADAPLASHTSLAPLDRAAFAALVPALRQRCAAALNVALPPVELEFVDALPPHTLELRLGERILAREGVQGYRRPAQPETEAWALALFHALSSGAEALLGLDALERAVERERARQPAVVRRALASVELVDLLHIARAFVRERVPLPSTAALLTALAEERVFQDPKERPRWPEYAREALADHWLQDLYDGVCGLGTPRWLQASGDLEDLLVARCDARSGRVQVHLSPAERRRILQQIRPSAEPRVDPVSGPRGPTVVLCTSAARPALAALLRGLRPHIPVFAVAELTAAGLEAPATHCLDLE